MLKILIIVTTICYTQSLSLMCTNITDHLSITTPATELNTTWIGFGPITVTCLGTGPENTMIEWIRQDIDGLNTTVQQPAPVTADNGKWHDSYNDFQAESLNKFPYVYWCAVTHPCFPRVESPGEKVSKSGGVDPPQSGPCSPFDLVVLLFSITNISDVSAYISLTTYTPRSGDFGFHMRYWYEKTTGVKIERSANFTLLQRNYWLTKLVPSTVYKVRLFVITRRGMCLSMPTYHTFNTLKRVCHQSDYRNLDLRVTATDGDEALVYWYYTSQENDTAFRLTWRKQKKASLPLPQIFVAYLNITTIKHKIVHLIPFTKYVVSLQVVTLFGCTTIANNRTFETLEDEPSLPRNVTANVVKDKDINVRWHRPKFPNGRELRYRVHYKSWADDVYTIINSVQAESYEIRNITRGLAYEIRVQAVNSHGQGDLTVPLHILVKEIRTALPVFTTSEGTTMSSEGTIAQPTSGEATGSDSSTGVIAGAVIGAVLLVVFLILLFCFLRRRKIRKLDQRSLQRFREMHGVANDGEESFPVATSSTPSLPVPDTTDSKDIDAAGELSYIVLLDDWEILRENIKVLEKKLGGGQFGIVKQGLHSTGKKDPEVVAIKMLKGGASGNDRNDLLTEIKILKDVNQEQHPNVLRLIGCCTSSEPILLIMEFCPGGNLRRFLLNSRVDSPDDDSSTYINISSTLTHRQLLKIAVDVASGMMHLASYKFVHRDLAARNVLIGDEDCAKLSDFGLARDISQDEEYVRANQNLLPVKWMALESLLHGRFSTASDVWSFGVLLYEITTLGREPYKGISPYNIVSHIGSGCRMDKPQHCSDEVYDMMKNCWKVEPSERPTFEELHKDLRAMLLDEEKNYINVTRVIDEGPLKPIINNDSFKDGSVRYTTSPKER